MTEYQGGEQAVSVVPKETIRRESDIKYGPSGGIWAWSALLAASIAIGATLSLMGRSLPTQASLEWLATCASIFVISLVWLANFARRAARTLGSTSRVSTRTLAALQSPLLALSLGGSLAIYLSDDINHALSLFLFPTPAVFLLLAVLATAVTLETALAGGRPRSILGWLQAATRICGHWAIPISLLLLGLLQATGYLWVIGNDFTRYWAITDGIATQAGYIVSVNQGNYIEGGMYRYSIEFPAFPLLLLASFALAGHDTLGAHLPALAANTALPLILFAFYHRAGLSRPSAYAGACLVATFPFLRLYTLNAPVPDAVFIALLVTAGYAYLRLVPTFGGRSAPGNTGGYRPWIAFGVAAGLATLGRPEGLMFVAFMFLGLAPYMFRRGPYISGLIFLAFIAPFSLLVMSNFGIPWPRNAGTTFAPQHIFGNLDWIQRRSLEQFSNAYGVSKPEFVVMASILAVAILAGTLWVVKSRWQLALLPIITILHTVTIFSVEPGVAGADQWFDFFRHISYGLPFAFLPLLLFGQRAEGVIGAVSGRLGTLRGARIPFLAMILLGISVYQLHLLAYPSLTHEGGRQVLTSDVWVSFHTILNNRYSLPILPFTRQEGVMMIDPDFEYIPSHLESVIRFFDPFSVLNTGNGTQYQFSALLVMLFGAVFALGEGLGIRRTSPQNDDKPWLSTAEENLAREPGPQR